LKKAALEKAVAAALKKTMAAVTRPGRLGRRGGGGGRLQRPPMMETEIDGEAAAARLNFLTIALNRVSPCINI
jgi:hypothetical protein